MPPIYTKPPPHARLFIESSCKMHVRVIINALIYMIIYPLQVRTVYGLPPAAVKAKLCFAYRAIGTFSTSRKPFRATYIESTCVFVHFAAQSTRRYTNLA